MDPQSDNNVVTPNISNSPTPNSSPPSSIQPVPTPSNVDVVTPTPPSPQPQAPVQAPETGKRSIATMLLVIFIVAIIAGVAGTIFYKHVHNTTPKPVANVNVGLMMAFSGGSSAMGYGASKGVALAKKQLGADNINVIEADSKCDPKAVISAINQLIKQHVVAIIGDGCSSASLAALPIANNAEVPMVSPSASSTKLSIPNDYFFRVVPPDTFQGAFMAQSIYDRGIRSVAVFYTNEPYGTSIDQVFQSKFESLGGKVVATAFAEPNVIDLTTQINAIKAANPQAVFFAPNSVVSGTAAIKLARASGIKAPFFGADIFYDQTIISNAPDAADGLTITSFPTGTKAFKQLVTNAYPGDKQLYATPQAYDAFHAIDTAIQKGATTGQQIKDALPNISFQGVSGHIVFDQNGEISDPSYKYDLLQVKDGNFTVL